MEITNANTSLRVATTIDADGADLYQYDALGRVVSKYRHDGDMNAFSCSKLKRTDFSYGAAGQLTEIRYPSGRAVVYGYGVDRARPSSVSVAPLENGSAGGVSALADSIVYDGAGQFRSLNWKNGAATWCSPLNDRTGPLRIGRTYDEHSRRA
jgi:YD repeat-containing protein